MSTFVTSGKHDMMSMMILLRKEITSHLKLNRDQSLKQCDCNQTENYMQCLLFHRYAILPRTCRHHCDKEKVK